MYVSFTLQEISLDGLLAVKELQSMTLLSELYFAASFINRALFHFSITHFFSVISSCLCSKHDTAGISFSNNAKTNHACPIVLFWFILTLNTLLISSFHITSIFLIYLFDRYFFDTRILS